MDYKELARRALANPKDLTPEEWKTLNEGPAGSVDLTPEDLDTVAGGDGGENTEYGMTLGCCKGYTNPKTCVSSCDGSDEYII